MALLALGVSVGAWAPWRGVMDHVGRYPAGRQVAAGAGKQWVLLYFGKSTCAWCNRPELPGAIEDIASAVQREAGARGAALVVIGVALDGSPRLGIGHLAKIGAFHEVSAGLGWENSVALARLWGGFGPPTATPQLILFEREVKVERYTPDRFYSSQDGRLLARKVGLDEILKWASAGAPVPTTAE